MGSEPQAVGVPAIGNQSSVTCIRSLGKRGIEPIGIAQEQRAPGLHSKYCSEAVFTPGPDENLEAYASTLLEVARRPEVQTITPHREGDIYVLAKYRDRFAEHVGTPWPSFETVRESQDRLALVERANDAGVAVPETALLTEWSDWDRRTVIKPRYSAVVADDRLTAADVVFPERGESPDVESIVEEMGHEPIVQEYVPGDPRGNEHGFYALFDHGTPVATFQHRRVRSFRYTGGASVFRESVKLPDLKRSGMAVLESLDWHGPAMVEFKRNPHTDEFVLMEVNPRFWGSLALSVAAGVDFPYWYYRLATDELDVPAVPDYRAGVGCHLLRGELAYALNLFLVDSDHVERPSRPRELLAVCRSLISDPQFDLLSARDPRPFLRDTRNFVGDAL